MIACLFEITNTGKSGENMKNLIFTSLLLTVGCGKKPGSYTVQTNAATDAAEANILEQADAIWSERGDKAKLNEALELYEKAFAANPTDKHALELIYYKTRGGFSIHFRLAERFFYLAEQ